MSKENTNKRLQQLYAKVGKSIHSYNMIAEGDKIIVGLSGGKDSMALLNILAQRQKFVEINYELLAVHVDMSEIPYKADVDWMKDMCEHLNVPFFHETISIDLSTIKKDSICYYCANARRNHIFKLSKDFNANKIAFGHHQDDALETLLMNMLYHGTISSIPGALKMFDGRIHLIRPLIDLSEKEITFIAKTKEFKKEETNCPYEQANKRDMMRKMLIQLEQNIPNARKQIMKSLNHFYLDYLPVEDKTKAVKRDLRL
jgi:tRNA 2-thiocytidine biosynthesis protein TtcA